MMDESTKTDIGKINCQPKETEANKGKESTVGPHGNLTARDSSETIIMKKNGMNSHTHDRKERQKNRANVKYRISLFLLL